MESNRKMKALYTAKVKAVRKANAIGFELDRLIEESWGFHYSMTNDDGCIDTLDYGIGCLSYETFVETMNKYREEYIKSGYLEEKQEDNQK